MSLHVLVQDLLITLGRVGIWTIVAWVLGIAIGIGSYRHAGIYRFVLPIVNLFRNISSFCWLPLIIMVSGLGELSVGLVLLLAMVFNAIILTVESMRSIPAVYKEQASLDGASGSEIFWSIELPIIYTAFIDLFRVLWSVAWVTVIAAEMLGVQSGMGFRLLDFRYLLMYRQMIGYILVIGITGVLVDYLLIRFKRLFPLVRA